MMMLGGPPLPNVVDGWVKRRLGEIGQFSKGRGIMRDDISDEGVPCIRYGEIYTRYFDYVINPVSHVPLEVAYTAMPIRKGDILFAGSGETAEDIGRCVAYLGEGEALAGSDTIVFRPLGNDSMFLCQLLNHPVVASQKSRFGQGDAIVHISAQSLSQIEIALPLLDEQRNIAKVLSDVDELLAALEELIAKKRAIKQVAMQKLLTGKTRLPGFDDEWETTTFGEIATIRNEKVQPSIVDDSTPCVELDHIGQGNGRLFGCSEAKDSTSTKYRFYCGDVLFGRLRPYLRKFWHADRDGICTTEIWPLAIDPQKVDSAFVHAIVQSDRFIEAASVSYGTHMPRADWTVIRDFEVDLPEICEQRALSAVFSDMDGEIEALEQRRDKVRAVKQGMMEQLLAGRVRLV